MDKTVQKLSHQIPSRLTGPEWSQVHETIVMLNLAVAQIEYSLTDGDESIDVLAESFTSMSEGIQTIGKAVKSFSQFSDVDAGLHNEVVAKCSKLEGEMQTAIIAFQFYDKLVQRLSHVRNTMTSLTEVIGDDEKLQSKDAWQQLQKGVRDNYTMEEDKKLFDAILSGKSILDAIKELNEQKKQADDDIELF